MTHSPFHRKKCVACPQLISTFRRQEMTHQAIFMSAFRTTIFVSPFLELNNNWLPHANTSRSNHRLQLHLLGVFMSQLFQSRSVWAAASWIGL